MNQASVCTLTDLVAGGRGLAAPFLLRCQIQLAGTAAPAVAARLHCEAILRHLPGRRLVVRASYQGATYAVKLFFGADARRLIVNAASRATAGGQRERKDAYQSDNGRLFENGHSLIPLD